MHEMSIAMDILAVVKKEMKENGVGKLKNLKIRVGEITAVEPESLRFCFEATIEKTPLEGATLHIEEVPLMGRCKNCGEEFRLERYFSTPCPGCGGNASDIVSGRELDIVSMEVE